MADKTPNYNLTKPFDFEFYDVNVQNENMDKIDQALKELQDEQVGKADLDDSGKVPAEQLPEMNYDTLGTAKTLISEHNNDKDAHPFLKEEIEECVEAAQNAVKAASDTYTGSAQSPIWNNYDSTKLTIGGTASATAAGTYSATFTPKDGYRWADDTITAKTVTWTINRAALPVPSQSGTLTYTGSALTPSWSNYDSNKITISGTTSGTNAGSYNATFTPKANYRWSDGTTSAKTVAWSIGKAAGSLSINKTSLSLNITTKTGLITVTRAGNGAISATSGNTGTATVSVSGTTVTVTGKATGNVTITINVDADTNHTAPASKTVSVTVNMPSGILANNTPAVIKAAAKAGQAANLWKVGDKVPIKINGTVGALAINSAYYAFIMQVWREETPFTSSSEKIPLEKTLHL